MTSTSKSNESLAASDRLFNSSNSSSPTPNSKSSTDIPSDLINFEVEENAQPTASSSLVHDHSLPHGLDCTYDEDANNYKFEYRGEDYQENDQEVEKLVETLEAPQTTRDEAVLAKTPTADHDVQTSRRPTLNLYECKYGYHFPTSPTSSMISELAKEVQKAGARPVAVSKPGKQISYGRTKITLQSDEEEQGRRLREMFPTATGPVIDQMVRIYHGREGLIKAALISLGYKRATEYGGHQPTAQSPIMLMMAKPSSKKLYEKLIGYFPEKDETLIKSLMYKHKEVEHEIISALVESSGIREATDERAGGERATHGGSDKTGVIMKLRYLKYLFPNCAEIELYHLLHCNNLNAQLVIEEVERRGHKRANIDEVMQNRKSQSQQIRAQQAALAAKDKTPQVNPVEAHRKRVRPVLADARITNLKENMKKKHPEVEDQLLLRALDAADYNEQLANKFIDEMKPVDEALYKQRYKFQCEPHPDVILYPCKGIQKEGNNSFMAVTMGEPVAIGREVVECQHALALLKVDASTCTREDFERPRFCSQAQGSRRADLTVGSIFRELEVRDSLRQGPQAASRQGSHYRQVCDNPDRLKPNSKAKGRQTRRAEGAKLAHRCGHNPKLLHRIHPFYLADEH